MASTYLNDLRVEEQAVGENSGTWGNKVNSAFSQIAEAFSYGTKQLAADANETFTMPDGTSDGTRSLYLKITSAGSLTATRTVTLGPNTVSKLWIIENATTGSQSITIAQGSGGTVTIPTGAVKMVYSDGAGAGAAVVDALVDLDLTGTTKIATANIDGGSIDGTTIGASTAAAITGTTGQFNTSLNVDGTITADGLTVSDTTGTVASLTSSGATTALNLNNTHANGWGSNIAFQTGGTAAGYFGSVGSLIGNTDQDLAAYSTAGNGFRVYTNGNNERLRITSAGNVGIGVTPSAWSTVTALQVKNAHLGGYVDNGYFGANCYFDGSNWRHIATNAASRIEITGGQFQFWNAPSATADAIMAQTQAMTLDASGNLLVGKTATNTIGTVGHDFGASGYAMHTRASSNVLYLNRTTDDGNIAEFYKDGTTVGSIGTRASLLKIGTGDVGLLFNSSSDAVLPENVDGGAGRDAAIDLGVAGARFKDLYLSGGVYVGGTGAANYLDDYEEGTWTPAVNAGSISGTSITYSGTYTKVGRLVLAHFKASNTTGDIQVGSYVTFSGFPFTINETCSSTVVTEDVDQFSRQGFAAASGTTFTLSACGSATGTTSLFASIAAYI